MTMNTSRRKVLGVAAWSAPVIAAAAAVPAAVASPVQPTLPPGIVVTPGGSPWTDARAYDGYIAEGIHISLADSEGVPLPVGTIVTLRLSQTAAGTGWSRNNFWFVQNPTFSAAAAQASSVQFQSLTLPMMLPSGLLSIYPTATTGYLRKGSDGRRSGQYLTVTAEGRSSQVHIINSSAAGGTNPGVLPA